MTESEKLFIPFVKAHKKEISEYCHKIDEVLDRIEKFRERYPDIVKDVVDNYNINLKKYIDHGYHKIIEDFLRHELYRIWEYINTENLTQKKVVISDEDMGKLKYKNKREILTPYVIEELIHRPLRVNDCVIFSISNTVLRIILEELVSDGVAYKTAEYLQHGNLRLYYVYTILDEYKESVVNG